MHACFERVSTVVLAAHQDAVKEEKKDVAYDVPEGAEIMLKKEDRDEFWFAPTKAKGKKGKSGKKDEGGSKSKPIKHNAETFRLFDQLKLDAPITTDDIAGQQDRLAPPYTFA